MNKVFQRQQGKSPFFLLFFLPLLQTQLFVRDVGLIRQVEDPFGRREPSQLVQAACGWGEPDFSMPSVSSGHCWVPAARALGS